MTGRVTFDFTGIRALVTGATSGIGHATAVLFRDAGAEVTVTGTRPAADDYSTDLLGMTYRQLVLTDAESVDKLAGQFDSLDVLVNNAGANFLADLTSQRQMGSVHPCNSTYSDRIGSPPGCTGR